MLQNVNFLCEIGTEEIPAGYLPVAIKSIAKLVEDTFVAERLDFSGVEVWATPRRIAIMAAGLADRQREEEAEIKGPSAKAAFDASGNPTRALEGYLAGNGVTRDDIYVKDTGKGEYVFARKKLASRPAEEIITALVKTVIADAPFPKRMRWSDKKLSFPRPISYFMILFNDRHIPFEIEGIASAPKTRGHYIQSGGMIEIDRIAGYQKALADLGIVVDQAERRALIHDQLVKAAAGAGAVLYEDEDLLDPVTFLVESPHAVVCDFDPGFLDVPDLALIAEMKEHQKYFPLVDAGGGLVNRFLVVSNNPATEHVKAGNERVITARFNDARFFYTEDRRKKLAERVDSLKDVLFHRELGTIYQKLERMTVIADEVMKKLGTDAATADRVRRAILLCKVDLNTAMVYEFPSLQGKIGKVYALLDGEDAEVASAIEEHYRPRFQGDDIPSGTVSIITSLSEKLDNLFGSFSVGNIPKGSADPYALRRQAGAVVDMLIRGGINLDLRDVLAGVSGGYKDGAALVDKLIEFFAARARTLFTEAGFRHDEIDACLSTGGSDYLELFRRAGSLHDFRKNENFSQMLLSFKRMNNIVQAFRKENPGHALSFDAKLLTTDEEKDLHGFFSSREGTIRTCIETHAYTELFELLISGKGIIDRFFDTVLVMDKDAKVRDNRLSVLEGILRHFTGLLDFARIEE